MQTVFERDALFKEVWAVPLTRLAKQYHLSDNGLRKVCKALDIPLPQSGHWARIAAGHKIETPRLPPTKGPLQFVSYGRTPTAALPSTAELAESEQWLQAQLALEKSPDWAITVNTKSSTTTPAITAAANAFQAELARLEKSRIAIEKASIRKPGKNWEPNFAALESGSWRDFVAKGSILSLPLNSPPLQVSEDSIARALRIWSALMHACEIRGHKLTTSGRLSISGQREKIQLRLTERIERVIDSTKSRSPVEVLMGEHVHNIPSGELRIFVGIRPYESKISDAPNKPLEDQLNSVFAKAYRLIAASKVRDARSEIRHLEYQGEVRARADEQAALVERERLIIEEKNRTESLLIEAEEWKKAGLIQAYLENIRHVASVEQKELSDETKAWLTWASAAVRNMDPTLKRLK